jgi:hypothetical protein
MTEYVASIYCLKCKLNKPRRPNQRYCGDCHNEYMRQWRTPEKDRAYYERNKTKCRARSLVNMRIRRGTMVKPMVCEECNSGGKLEAHHDDYTRPAEVRWLCKSCHNLI